MNQRPRADGPIKEFNGAKVFSATMVQDREHLGDKVMAWIQSNPRREIVDTVVTLSSDRAFHCLAITVFFWEKPEELAARA
jgi:hypothetical protein